MGITKGDCIPGKSVVTIWALRYSMGRKIILITLMIGIFLFSPLSASIEAQAMDSPKGDLDIVMELIEGWKKEVEQRGLEHYLSRYGDPSQKAGSSRGKKGHSQRVDIAIEDVRIFRRDDGTITTTFLRRAHSGQFQDVGVGMLSFKREGARWKVDQEEWYSLSVGGSIEDMAYTVTIGPGNAPRVMINNLGGKGQRKWEIPKKRVALGKEVSANPDIGEYTIGAGDIIIISVWGHGDLTKEVVISEKGTFSYPLIGEVKAAGLTVNGLEAKLVELLSNGYVINPNVSVRIQGYQSKTVYVLGQVRSPGSYSLHKETSLIEIISRAGGVTDNAGWIIEVVRPSERSLDKPVIPHEAKKEDIIRVDVEGLLGGRPEDNIRIEGGDTIFIPPAAFYYIFGEVKRPGSYKLMRDTTVLKAVILAGGFTEKASKRRIKIRRKEGAETIKVRVKLDDPVLPQDTIIVPESFF
jgi:polysaccharide export outer membrane protein